MQSHRGAVALSRGGEGASRWVSNGASFGTGLGGVGEVALQSLEKSFDEVCIPFLVPDEKG